MARHKTAITKAETDPAVARWHRAAEKEGLTYQEFTKRALAQRADHVLTAGPGRVLGAFVGLLEAAAGSRETREKVCVCGHGERNHVTFGTSGGRPGSCGRAVCDCRNFREDQGRRPEPPA